MANPSTLLRFKIELSDVDRGVYDSLDLRVAQHPSENAAYLITRVLAYALNFQEGLEFSPGGLSDTDAPCLFVASPMGGSELWVEVGNPSARKLNKASKQSKRVAIYTYKETQPLVREMKAERIHKVEEIEIYRVPQSFLQEIEPLLERENRWALLNHDGALSLTIGNASNPIVGELQKVSLED